MSDATPEPVELPRSFILALGDPNHAMLLRWIAPGRKILIDALNMARNHTGISARDLISGKII